jgi:hypothetical protein
VIVRGTLRERDPSASTNFKVTWVWDLEAALPFQQIPEGGGRQGLDISRLVATFPPRQELVDQMPHQPWGCRCS